MAKAMKVACIVGDGFEDSEFRVPYDEMRKAGMTVTLIGTKAGEEVSGKTGKEKIKIERSIDDARVDDFDLLFIPGGYSPDHLRADDRFVEFVRAFDEQKKPIAAVCHGPQLFISARLVKGRTLTAWKTVQDDLEAAGANVRDEPVVRDGNWITSRQPDDLPQFARAIIDVAEGRETSTGMLNA